VRIWYTIGVMEKADLILILGGTFFIGAGLGYYLARILFG